MAFSVRAKTQWMLSVAALCSVTAIVLYSTHVISTGWLVGIIFAVVIPLATLKAFADFRQR
jgi:CHASE2 domain-containing sensor protein